MHRILLYHLADQRIEVKVEAYFEAEKLVIEECDFGKVPKGLKGNSDYEFSTTIYPEEINRLYSLFNVPGGDKRGLLEAIKTRFNSGSCYSEFGNFLYRNHI